MSEWLVLSGVGWAWSPGPFSYAINVLDAVFVLFKNI